MSETTRLVIHYLEAITRKAGLSGFDEIRAELESADEADAADRRRELEELRVLIRDLRELLDALKVAAAADREGRS